MKDFKVFVEHAELVAEWNKDLKVMLEKVGKKPAKSEKRKKDLRITKDVATNPDSAGLRLKIRNPEKGESDEATLVDVDPPHAVVRSPEGDEEEMTATNLMTKYKVD